MKVFNQKYVTIFLISLETYCKDITMLLSLHKLLLQILIYNYSNSGIS